MEKCVQSMNTELFKMMTLYGRKCAMGFSKNYVVSRSTASAEHNVLAKLIHYHGKARAALL